MTTMEFTIIIDRDTVTGEYGLPGTEPEPAGHGHVKKDPLGFATVQFLNRWLSLWDVIDGASDQDKPGAGSRADRRMRMLLEPKTLEMLGTHLWELILGNDVGRELRRRIPAEGSPPLRLSILFTDDADARLRALPWEFLYDVEGRWFLSAKTELLLTRFVRTASGRAKVVQVGEKEQVRALLIAALPADEKFDSQRLALGRLRTALKDVVHLEEPVLVEEWDEKAIRKVLEDRPCHIVHVVGICRGDPGDPQIYVGGDDFRDPKSFVDCLTAGRPRPRLIILQLCDYIDGDATENFERLAPALIEREVPAVLALQYAARRADPDYVGLGKLFYESLVGGDSIGTAVQKSRHELENHHDRRFGAPVLYLQEDGVLLLRPLRRSEMTESTARTGAADQRSLRDVLIRVAAEQLEGAELIPVLQWIRQLGRNRSPDEVCALVQAKLYDREQPSSPVRQAYSHMFMAVNEWIENHGRP
jgi:hypothetical protein